MAKTKAKIKTKTTPVTVTVDANEQIHCTPNPVKIKGRNVLLTFQLETAGYVFPPLGAVVVTDPGTQFPFSSWTLPPSNTTAVLLDLGTETGGFSYAVHVQSASGKRLWIDPTIENEP